MKPGLSCYLRSDSKYVATQRARLRFDLALQQAFHRYDSSNPADCPFCVGLPETREHVLLECAAYERFRRRLQDELENMSLGVDASLLTVLGGCDALLPDLAALASLRHTARFLRDLFCLRTYHMTGTRVFYPL